MAADGEKQMAVDIGPKQRTDYKLGRRARKCAKISGTVVGYERWRSRRASRCAACPAARLR